MKSADILQRDVLDELAWDSKVDSSTVQVTATEDGVVTLKGTVRTYSEKIDAEKAVKRVSGVKGIANDLTIELLKK